ncbi:hypothetical protein [Chroococcidiopsis sp. CCALA 051]|uniref:hypothetical protein n=1 Tax=Chroococcidiopsis sp. CCALA 051 TaxID=869949 RepID=UPI0013048668|nr:hypothetical protein [Chroococcidiopsis sp. CCALA 051]
MIKVEYMAIATLSDKILASSEGTENNGFKLSQVLTFFNDRERFVSGDIIPAKY